MKNGNLILVDFQNKKVAKEFTLEELLNDYYLEYENLIINQKETLNLKEIKKFNFHKNFKVIKNNKIKKAS